MLYWVTFATVLETRGKNRDESEFHELLVELVDRPCDHVEKWIRYKTIEFL